MSTARPDLDVHQATRALRDDLIVVAMQDALLRELRSGLSRGGPESAMNSCHIEVTRVSQWLEGREGIDAGRTSNRLRKPSNQARPWASALVEGNAGRRASDVEGFAVDLGDKVGVLRPIVQQSMCAGCHGSAETISPTVRQLLATRYPKDTAVGFADGTIRGWFWVEMPKP